MLMQAHAARPDLGDIRASLRVTDVLQRYGVEVKKPPRGDWYGHQCPRTYHRKSERAFVINPESGLWQCFAGCVGRDGKPLGGDLFTFIAEREGLSLIGEDFAKVAAIAADIAVVAGVELSPEEHARRRQAHREDMERRRREQDEQKWRHRADSIVTATAYWNTLATRGAPGESYLWERGIVDAVARGLIRFDRDDRDSIALALRTYDGQVANVIRRRLPAWAPTKDDRFRPLTGLWAKGTYVHAIADIGPGRDAVLCEGFADSITAAVAWPTAIVLGARSASDLPTIAKYAAPLVHRHGVRLMIASHRDDAGFKAAAATIEEAHNAGLRLDENTLEIVKHPEDDLNASWCRGWRPSTRSTS
jgi:DNA primase